MSVRTSVLDVFHDEKQSLTNILTHSSRLSNENDNSSVWKVLIYDERGQRILAPLIKVPDILFNPFEISQYSLKAFVECIKGSSVASNGSFSFMIRH